MRFLLWTLPLLLIAGLAAAQDKAAPPAAPGAGRPPALARPGAVSPANMPPRQFGPGLVGIGVMPARKGEPLGLHPALMKLPEAKQEKLRTIHAAALQSAEAIIEEIRTKRVAMGEALRKYPLDTADITKQEAALQKLQEKLFTTHINALADSQKIVDKETWNAVMQGMPFGHGGPGPQGGRPGGPGMQGPPPGLVPPGPAARTPAK